MKKIIGKFVKDNHPQTDLTFQLVSLDDLNHFKQQLINELLAGLKFQNTIPPPKWMKLHEVRKLLRILPCANQTFKFIGIIPHTKIGSITFYNYAVIQQILEVCKVPGKVNTSGLASYANFTSSKKTDC